MKACVVPKSHLHKFEPVPFVKLGVCRRRGESGGKKRLATDCKPIEKAAKLRRSFKERRRKERKEPTHPLPTEPPTVKVIRSANCKFSRLSNNLNLFICF